MNEHVPVMLDEVIEHLNIRDKHIYVDMTIGGGGHSKEILKRIPHGYLYGFDQDDYAMKRASETLADFSNYQIVKDNFVNAKSRLNAMGVNQVDGILFDLGVSSFQFDIADRGFSYKYDNPLDMRMDQTQKLTAADVVNTYTYDELVQLLFEYGEEKFARSIANQIIKRRNAAPIQTTFELVDIIKSALPEKVLRKKGHPAKQTFQALRIEVNDELNRFSQALKDAISMLAPKGRIAVITFHSLEDRICKQVFRKYSTIDIPKGVPILVTEEPILKLINKKVILPKDSELNSNRRAHSAKLRAAEKN